MERDPAFDPQPGSAGHSRQRQTPIFLFRRTVEHAARDQFQNTAQRQPVTAINDVGHQDEPGNLTGIKCIEPDWVSDVQHIGLDELTGSLLQWIGPDNGSQRPGPGGDELVWNESLGSQLEIHVGEGRLIAVQPMESDLGLHGDSPGQFLPARLQDGQLSALNVDLQEIDGFDLRNVIQSPGVHLLSPGDPGQCWKVGEQIELSLVRFEQTGETGGGAEMQRVSTAVTDGVRQVSLVGTCSSAQIEQGIELRLEPGDSAETGVQQQAVRRVTVDGVGTDIDHVDLRYAALPPSKCRPDQIQDLPGYRQRVRRVGGRIGGMGHRTIDRSVGGHVRWEVHPVKVPTPRLFS